MSSTMAQPIGDGYGNSKDVEYNWAVKCHEYADIHFSLISALEPAYLHLSQLDENIYKHFKSFFPAMSVNILDEDELKSESSKTKWRQFCEEYKSSIDEYNFGTLLRLDPSKEYNPENTTLVPKIQFLAIEIARNREGYNDGLRLKRIKEYKATQS
ncbi:protein PBDC1-like [Argonauta hians]